MNDVEFVRGFIYGGVLVLVLTWIERRLLAWLRTKDRLRREAQEIEEEL